MNADLVRGTVHILERHVELSIRELGLMLGRPAADVRAQLEAFNDVDIQGEGLQPMFHIRPVGGWPDDGPDPLPSDDDTVTFSAVMGGGDLGLRYLDEGVLGPLVAAAEQLRAMEPENLQLAAATDILGESMMKKVAGHAGFRTRYASVLQRAANERRKVRITYSNAWTPKVTSRVVEPFQVMSTSRGYELDAGPLDDAGQPRTFLVNRIRDYSVLDEQFEPDPRIARAVAATRRPTTVTGTAGHRAVWAVRLWTDGVEQRDADDKQVRFTASVLPPVAERVALLSLAAGLGKDGRPAVQLDDPELAEAVRRQARRLREHHRL